MRFAYSARESNPSPLIGLFLVTALSALPLESAVGAEGGASNYFPGAFGAFAPGMAPSPGPVFTSMTLFLDADIDEAALQGRLAASIETFAAVETLVGLYAFDREILGAQPGVGLFLPFAYVEFEGGVEGNGFPGLSADVHEKRFAVGDLSAMPLTLWWEVEAIGLHLNLYELVIIPSGQYDTDDLVNVGRNYWGFDTVLAATWLSEKTGTEISAVQGITVNTENEQTNYRTGSEYHLDAMVNQFLAPQIAIGFHLYTYQQVTKDSGTPPSLGGFKGQSVGIGPQVLWRPALPERPGHADRDLADGSRGEESARGGLRRAPGGLHALKGGDGAARWRRVDSLADAAWAHASARPLVRQVVLERRDDPHALDVGIVAVAVLDRELALRRALELAEPALGVGGELLGDDPRVARRLLDHLGLDLVQALEEVLGLQLVVLLGEDDAGLAELEQLAVRVADRLDVLRVDGDDLLAEEAEADVLVAVALGLLVGDRGGADGDLALGEAAGGQEPDHHRLLLLDRLHERRQVVVRDVQLERPDRDVGGDVALREALHAHGPLEGAGVGEALADEMAGEGRAEGDARRRGAGREACSWVDSETWVRCDATERACGGVGA